MSFIPKAVSSSSGKLAIISFISSASSASEEKKYMYTKVSATTATDQVITDLAIILNSCWKTFLLMASAYS